MAIATETRAIITAESRTRRPQEPRTSHRTPGQRAAYVVLYVVLAMFCVVQLFPFYIALTTATKPISDQSPQWMLGHFTLTNFATAIQSGGILRAILNSAIVTLASTVLVCVIGALAAYPLARRATRFNAVVLSGIVALMMVPPLSILVPLYSMMSNIGGINTYWGIILIQVTGQLPLAVFLYSAFIRNIPVSLEEAAAMDGAHTLQIFLRVVLPLLKPVTATVIILTSVNVWNEYALSGYFLTDPSVKTIAPAIASFFSASSNNLNAASAASLLAVIPVLVAFLFLQKYFIKGMIAGAEK